MKNSPRILIIPSWYPPDGGHFFQDQAEALALQGFQVDVMVNRLVGLTRLSYSERNTLKRFSVSTLNGTRLIRSWQLKLPYLEIWNLRRWSNSTLRLYGQYSSRFGEPDLLLAHSSIWAGYSVAQISKKTGIPYLLVEHRSRFTLPQEKVTQYLKPEYRPYLEKAFGQARQIITVSEALQPMILNYTDEREKLITLPNIVDTTLFSRREGENIQDLRILSVGRLDSEKGMDLLINAFGKLSRKQPGAILRIVGAGPELSKLKSLAEKNGIADRVIFLGKMDVEGVRKELSLASLFALASRFEAFGVVFIEAMAMGIPVLATRAGGPQTFIPDFAGEVVEIDNAQALFNGMEKIVQNRDHYDEKRIRTYAIENFSGDAVMKKYAKLISGVLYD